jgi:hypothetical protein
MANDKIIIVVNATEHAIDTETVTYDQVVKLAYPRSGSAILNRSDN